MFGEAPAILPFHAHFGFIAGHAGALLQQPPAAVYRGERCAKTIPISSWASQRSSRTYS